MFFTHREGGLGEKNRGLVPRTLSRGVICIIFAGFLFHDLADFSYFITGIFAPLKVVVSSRYRIYSENRLFLLTVRVGAASVYQPIKKRVFQSRAGTHLPYNSTRTLNLVSWGKKSAFFLPLQENNLGAQNR